MAAAQLIMASLITGLPERIRAYLGGFSMAGASLHVRAAF
jgi:hypothetical protein